MKVINFHGAPGVGKTTAATGLLYCMKKCQLLVDYVPEFAKEEIYKDSPQTLNDQKWVLANQDRRLHVLRKHVDFAVSDSPLVLSAYYGGSNITRTFRRHIIETFLSYDNLNYFVDRNPNFEFQKEGRIHNEQESDMIADKIKTLLVKEGITFKTIVAGNELPERVFADLAQSHALEIPASGATEAWRIIERAAQFDDLLRARMERLELRSSVPNVPHQVREQGRALTL